MFDLRTALQSWSPAEQREILYFLVRYFKQSHFLDEDGKDIFDDVFDRSPSPAIRDATLTSIAGIEANIGQKASKFNDQRTDDVLDLLISIDDELRDDLNQADRDKAAAFFNRLP